MKKIVLKCLSIGLTFSGIAFMTVSIIGYNSRSLMIIMYLYIVLAVFIGILNRINLLENTLSGSLGKVLVVVGEEEQKMKHVLTGETYRLKGDLQKLK